MIRVNCVNFNMTAADAQVAQLGIGGLWARYCLGLNAWVGLSSYSSGCWNVTQCFDLFLPVVYENSVNSVDPWVLVFTKLGAK